MRKEREGWSINGGPVKGCVDEPTTGHRTWGRVWEAGRQKGDEIHAEGGVGSGKCLLDFTMKSEL